MSATAAASAAVATTQLNPAAAEKVLVGSLQQQGRLSAAAPAEADSAPAAALASGAAASVWPKASPGVAVPSANGSFEDLGALAGTPTQLAAAAARGGRELLVAAALERSCLLVESEMSVARALALMQADDQRVAVVLGQDGAVMGLVTRDVLEECAEAAAHEAAAAASSGSDTDAGGAGAKKGGGRGLALRAEALPAPKAPAVGTSAAAPLSKPE